MNIKVVRLLLALVLTLALSAPCALATGIDLSGLDDVMNMLDSWNDEPVATPAPTASAEDAANVLAALDTIYTFALNGVSYSFPCPMSDLLNNGWQYTGWAADPGAGLEAMTYSFALLKNDAGQRLTVHIMNPTENAVTVNDTLLMSITVKANDTPPDFATSAGLTLGVPYSEVARLYGQCTSENSMSDGGKTCKYNFYRTIGGEGSSIKTSTDQGNWDDELSVICDASGTITSIYMMHTRF